MQENEINIIQASEISAIIEFGYTIDEATNKKIRIFCEYLDNNPAYEFIEYIPYFTSVSIIYDPIKIKSNEPFKHVKSKIIDLLSKIDFSLEYEENIVEIPVCYEKELAPDIEFVAETNNLTVEQVINIHSNGRYLVYMIGFSPGFPYLGGLDERIFTPRRDTPRIAIPEGSVGIAGMQTGIYPIETPGGWQIIGRTPIKLFDLASDSKILLKCGDIARFCPISYNEYLRLKEKIQ